MAISYDTSARVIDAASGGTSGSANFTVANNSTRMLVVYFICNMTGAASDDVAVTFDSVSMTKQIFKKITYTSPGVSVAVYALSQPSVGTKTLAWSSTQTKNDVAVFAYSFYDTGSNINVVNGSNNSGSTSISIDTTTTVDGCVPVSGGYSPNYNGRTGMANNFLQGSSSSNEFMAGWDNAVSPAGSYTESLSGSTTDERIICTVAIGLPQAYTLAISNGSFTLTLKDVLYNLGRMLSLSVLSFAASFQTFLLTYTSRWTNGTKNTTSFTNESKSASPTYTNETKNSSPFTNEEKH